MTNQAQANRKRAAWVKYQLELRGYSFASLAREHGVTRQQPQAALKRSYPKWERILADALGLTLHELWPDRYNVEGEKVQ